MPDIIKFISSLNSQAKQEAVNKITDTNLQSSKRGLILSEEDAIRIIAGRDEALKTTGRLELGFNVLNRIITVFSHSPYLNQADYAEKISELVEVFYHFKNETRDQIGDDDLINIMRERFDNRCHGSMDLLAGRELELLAEEIRCGRYYGQLSDDEEEA